MIRIFLSRLKADESGVTAVEFGLLLLPMSIVLLGFMQLGYQSYVRAQLQGTVHEVARVVSVENPQIGGDSGTLEERVEAHIRDRMAAIAQGGEYDIRLSNYRDFTGVGKPETLITDQNGNGRHDPGDCWEDSNPNGSFDMDAGATGIGGADDVVFHQVSLTLPHLFPISGIIGGSDQFTVSASTAVRSQPYAGQREAEVRC